MRRYVFHSALAVSLAAVFPFASQAQSSDFERQFSPRGTEARLSFTLPMGESTDKIKTAPRLDFAVRNYQTSDPRSRSWIFADQSNYRQTRLGFTLTDNPQLMLNDQVLILTQDQEQAHIDKWGKAGLTVAAVALTAVAVVAVAFAACDAGDGSCFDEE